MKKLLLALLLSISVSHAYVVPDNSLITTTGTNIDGVNSFSIGNVNAICLNNTVYIALYAGRRGVMALSHNPLTNTPYYCFIKSIVTSEDNTWATRATNYIQDTVIYHSYTSVIKQKGSL